jgi:hypothetical protein
VPLRLQPLKSSHFHFLHSKVLFQPPKQTVCREMKTCGKAVQDLLPSCTGLSGQFTTLLKPLKRHFQYHLLHDNEEVEMVVREWLRYARARFLGRKNI